MVWWSARVAPLVILASLGACGQTETDDEERSAGGTSGKSGSSGGVSGRAHGGDAGTPGTGGSNGGSGGGAAGNAATGGSNGGSAEGGAAGAGGSNDGGTDGGGGIDGGVAPPRLIIFYTRWGTNYPEWWPTVDATGAMQFTNMLAPLQPFAKQMTLVSGLANVNETDGVVRSAFVQPSGVMDASRTLLTAQPAADLVPAGPSLDAAIGTCGGQDGPPIRLRVGEFEGDEGLFWSADGQQLPSESDPHQAAQRWLGTDIDAPDPSEPIDQVYGEVGRAHARILAKALAARTACVGTLSWGDALTPTLDGLNPASYRIHDMSHSAPDAQEALVGLGNMGGPFVDLQRYYAGVFAYLLELLQSTPFEGKSLFDRSVVLWISESGAGSTHTGEFIPVILAGGALKPLGLVKLHPPRWTIERTQADLLAPLAQLWGISQFAAPALITTPITELSPN